MKLLGLAGEEIVGHATSLLLLLGRLRAFAFFRETISLVNVGFA